MEGEARVLEDRVESHAFGRYWNETGKGIRGEDREREEASRDQSLDGEGTRTERGRHIAAEHGESRPVDRKDQHPEDE